MLVSGSVGAAMVLLHFRISLVRPSVQNMRAALVEGWHLFVSSAAIGLYTNTNVFLVGLLAGNVEAGYFSAAEKVVRAMNGLIAPISRYFPHVNSLVKESRTMALQFTRRMLGYMVPLTLAPSLVLLLLAGPVAHICFVPNCNGSTPQLRWIALLPVPIAFSYILGFGYHDLIWAIQNSRAVSCSCAGAFPWLLCSLDSSEWRAQAFRCLSQNCW